MAVPVLPVLAKFTVAAPVEVAKRRRILRLELLMIKKDALWPWPSWRTAAILTMAALAAVPTGFDIDITRLEVSVTPAAKLDDDG